ncbi:MAG: hypothetical protein ACFFE5_01370 [Candidatus Thorarchaeota archaeon]
MLFQLEPLFFVLWLILATIIVALIIFIAVLLIVSKTKASDKKFMIVLLALICVLIIPVVLSAIDSVLGTIGTAIAFSGQNHLIRLTPIIGFLIIFVLTKYLIDVAWDNSIWISLLTLFFLFLLYTLIPGLYEFLQFGL